MITNEIPTNAMLKSLDKGELVTITIMSHDQPAQSFIDDFKVRGYCFLQTVDSRDESSLELRIVRMRAVSPNRIEALVKRKENHE